MQHCRLTFFTFLLFYLSQGFANQDPSAWSCEQSTENKQWKCTSSTVKPETDVAEDIEVGAEAPLLQPQILDLHTPLPSVSRVANPYAPPKTLVRRPGWNCKVNAENETWDCSLVGRDSKGKARLMEGQESIVRSWFGAAYDQRQERVFRTLQESLHYNPWAACSNLPDYQTIALPSPDERTTTDMEVTADYSEIFDKEITSFYGNVDLQRADQHVLSDMATYDSHADSMDMQGDVYYSESELALFSKSGFLNLAANKTTLRDVLFISPSAPLRGSADVVYRDSPTFSYYKEASFTSCPPANQDWIMHADRLKMNTQSGKAAAKHAWLEFKGVPFFYSPYISFPLDDRRLTGFLTPTWGVTGRSGFDIQVPFYWNIAPNYDALFWGRYLGKRGPALGTTFRYLTEMFQGSVEFEMLPSDSAAGDTRGFAADGITPLPTTNSFRGAARVKNTSQFTSALRSDIDLNYVSDPYYFDDLGNSLHISTESFLRSFANLTYNELFGDEDEDQTTVDFLAQVENYQVIDVNQTSRPYQRLPQVLLNLHRDSESYPLEMDLGAEFVYFEKRENNDFFGLPLDDFQIPAVAGTTEDFVDGPEPTGSRINIHPSVSFPYETASAFITPKIALQHTQYWLKDQPAGRSNNISRTLPIASLDTGLFFEKAYQDGDSTLLHTIEPRLFYVYIPHTNQDDIPLFDTGEFDFTGSQLFRENRFTGSDRVGDANQLTYALTSRLLSEDDGTEILNFSIGQIMYFQDREVTLDETRDPETEMFSNIIVGLNGRITDDLSYSSGLQWNPESNRLDRFNALLRYRGPEKQIVNLGYRFRRDEFNNLGNISKIGINQSDFSFLWPLTKEWSIVGRWQYSFENQLTLDSFLGVELDSCCWRFRIIGRRFVSNVDNNTGDNQVEPENAIFFQFELKGLSSFGEDVEQFLERQINGYRRP